MLTVDLPWIDAAGRQIDDLVVRQGPTRSLAYGDGIELDVAILDPGRFRSVEDLVDEARRTARPGRIVLIAGSVPLSWRAELRRSALSFVDVSGVAEIDWPRVRVSARRFGQPVQRRRNSLSFQKGHALVAQELLIAALDGSSLTISELAARADVTVPTASKAVSQLAEHALVAKERDGRNVRVSVIDRTDLARRLASRSAWPGDATISGYLWGRSVFDVAARISRSAEDEAIPLAVSGRVGATYLGVVGTSSPSAVRCWVDAGDQPLADVAEQLGLDPAPDEAANAQLSSDPWRVGTTHRSLVTFDEWTAAIAHPVRVWCDLHDEPRGADFAAQLWGVLGDGG